MVVAFHKCLAALCPTFLLQLEYVTKACQQDILGLSLY